MFPSDPWMTLSSSFADKFILLINPGEKSGVFSLTDAACPNSIGQIDNKNGILLRSQNIELYSCQLHFSQQGD